MALTFSSDDVHDLISLFPLEIFQSDSGLEASRTFASPFLLPSHSGDGFLISSHLLKKFREIVGRGEKHPFTRLRGLLTQVVLAENERVPIPSLSHQLDISADVVLELVNQSRYDTILSGDKKDVLTKSERDLLWDKLRYTCSQKFLSVSDFSHDHNISLESIYVLSKCTKSYNDTNTEDNTLFELDHPTDRSKGPFLCSLSYRSVLNHSIRDVLETAYSEAKPAFLTAKSFSGIPPLWYISNVVKDALDDTGNGLSGKFENCDENQLLFKPQSLFLRLRDEILSNLLAGDASYVDLSWFTEELPNIYPRLKDAETYVQNCSSNNIVFHSGYAISRTWLDNNLIIKRRELDKVGYTNLSTTLTEFFPDEVLSEVISLQKNQLLDSQRYSSSPVAVHTVNEYVIQTNYKDDISAFIKQVSRNQAKVQWEKLGQVGQQDYILKESEMYDDFLRKDPDNLLRLPVFKAIFQEIESDAKAAFTEEISRLEAENEADFSALWIERVASRFRIYKSGAEAIEDIKLQTQLLELLVSYTVKELIPETIARAQSKGLLRSRKTRRHTQKLSTALNTSASGGKAGPDLQHVIAALEKYMKQQSIEWSDATNLAEWKSAQVKELVRGMQKDTDGPRLFLTLIVVLLANQQDGIVYATGKLAPKLMKLLKGVLGSNGYERVEGWKDAVKAGKLTAEDQEEMKLLATAG